MVIELQKETVIPHFLQVTEAQAYKPFIAWILHLWAKQKKKSKCYSNGEPTWQKLRR